MIRIIARKVSCESAANVIGAMAHVEYKTFDLFNGPLEKFLTQSGELVECTVLGAQVVAVEPMDKPK